MFSSLLIEYVNGNFHEEKEEHEIGISSIYEK
jgi:hypothetical protein